MTPNGATRGHPYRPRHYNHRLSQQVDRKNGGLPNYLHAVFAFAQRREEVDINPVTAAAKPTQSKSSSDFSFLTPAQVDAVVAAVADDHLRAPTERSSSSPR